MVERINNQPKVVIENGTKKMIFPGGGELLLPSIEEVRKAGEASWDEFKKSQEERDKKMHKIFSKDFGMI